MLLVTLTNPSNIVSKIRRSSYVDTYNEFDELYYYAIRKYKYVCTCQNMWILVVKISLAHERKEGQRIKG